MGSNSCRSVPEADGRWLTEVFAFLPRHRVSRPDLEVVASLLSTLVLVAGA